MKKTIIFIAVASTSLLSAEQYYQQHQQYYPQSGSCPGGNCPYQGYSQGASYYQGTQSQTYYQGNQPAGYHHGNPPGYQGSYPPGSQKYDQGTYQNQPNQPNRNQQYNQNQTSYRDSDTSYNNPSQSQQSDYRASDKDKPASYTNAQRRDQRSIPDQEIAKEVHGVISGWFSSYPNVTFDVNDGVVSLNGSVEKAEDKSKIETEIKKIEGVKRIENNITLPSQRAAVEYYKSSPMVANVDTKMYSDKKQSQDFGATESDKKLNAKIRDKIRANWPNKNFETIVIRTTNGLVIISGTVEENDDVKNVNDAVKGVEGVKSVNNKLSVKKR